ncbi:hypothetical protein [Streptomyces syringium]|uniref:hypothetical protein n=1 Tax=Streptomyces syringium TaxID=76729 RepID=UPI0033D8B51E
MNMRKITTTHKIAAGTLLAAVYCSIAIGTSGPTMASTKSSNSPAATENTLKETQFPAARTGKESTSGSPRTEARGDLHHRFEHSARSLPAVMQYGDAAFAGKAEPADEIKKALDKMVADFKPLLDAIQANDETAETAAADVVAADDYELVKKLSEVLPVPAK